MADVQKLLQEASTWTKNFDKPLSLGAKARVAVVTCMDSRLIPEAMFGFGVGDAEVGIQTCGGSQRCALLAIFVTC